MEESAERIEEANATLSEDIDTDEPWNRAALSDTDDDYYALVLGPTPPSSPVFYSTPPSSPMFYSEPYSSPSSPSPSPSPMNSPPTLDQPDGLLSIRFQATIKACISRLLDVVITDREKEACYGCQIHHPSQTQHQCLDPLSRYYVFIHFEELMKRLWTDRFISGVMRVLETQGLVATPSRVQGVCEAFLHELKDVDDIPAKIKETTKYVLGEDKEKLLNNLVTFWSNSAARTKY